MAQKRIAFIEMMGKPGSYDASVYDHFEDKDQEGLWFIKNFSHVPGIAIITCNVCLGEKLPEASEIDGLVLAGTYNSVHDHTDWQKTVRSWLSVMREYQVPILAICGSHQLLSHQCGSDVERLPHGPCAGTFPLEITQAGRSSPLMTGISADDGFHFANSEHVTDVPKDAVLLASSGRIPVAALDYGDHCYSTQFHPEGTHETLGTVWRFRKPELMKRYRKADAGARLVENFLRLVASDNVS